ncbi:MAG: universal stress protein [Verrucomicrobiota bacterium]
MEQKEALMYARILVPVDGSDTSTRGLREASRLAAEQGAELRCLYVIDEHLLFDAPFAYPGLIEKMREAGETILECASAEARGERVCAEAILRESGGRRVSRTILDEALSWPADLIVMGTHGRRGFSHLALGSDAELVVRESPVPVLLVRASD